VDSSKLVNHLGQFLLPVEIIPFAMELTIRQIQNLGGIITMRMDKDQPYITDNGNMIIDCDFKEIERVDQLHHALNAIPGVVENGLFPKSMVSKVIVGFDNGEVKSIS